MIILPDPVIVEHEGVYVVRDDMLPGGTKRRAIHVLFNDAYEEYCYASPVYGYAQVALAYAAHDYGKRATIFCAKRAIRHRLTLEAEAAGATIHEVEHGYLNVVHARASEYATEHNAWLLPFGLNTPRFVRALADVACALPIQQPTEVWSVVGSGTLSRSLQLAWPAASFYGVRIGAEPAAGRALIFDAPEPYEKDAKHPPPFPSCPNYDSKGWDFVKRHAIPNALFWNCAG